PPGRVEAVISIFAELLELPSGQFVLTVDGENLEVLLAREATLQPVLDKSISEGLLSRYGMLAQFIGSDSAVALQGLPNPEQYRERVKAALQANSMAESFSAEQFEAYRVALNAPSVTMEDMNRYSETRRLSASISETESGLRESVRLFGIEKPPQLIDAITQSGIPGVQLVDMRAQIERELAQLRERVAFWLGFGTLIAFIILTLGLGDWRKAVGITRTTTAAVCLTAAVLVLTGGTIGIFQIVALTLVVGIGIDYGLFLIPTTEDSNPDDGRDRFRSVALCAGSTLIAFSVMSIAPIKILQEIGLTVSLGVIAMVILNLAQNGSREPEAE
ncbi:MAG: hypothetical protein V7788_16050, partial [Alphaproteobacteria bacterium]